MQNNIALAALRRQVKNLLNGSQEFYSTTIIVWTSASLLSTATAAITNSITATSSTLDTTSFNDDSRSSSASTVFSPPFTTVYPANSHHDYLNSLTSATILSTVDWFFNDGSNDGGSSSFFYNTNNNNNNTFVNETTKSLHIFHDREQFDENDDIVDVIYDNRTPPYGMASTSATSTRKSLNNYWALLAVLLVIFTAAGNILVCLAITWERRLQNVTNYFLMSLAITDLMVAILVMPLGILTLVKGKS